MHRAIKRNRIVFLKINFSKNIKISRLLDDEQYKNEFSLKDI